MNWAESFAIVGVAFSIASIFWCKMFILLSDKLEPPHHRTKEERNEEKG